jgi:tetratricopeptide (TPR) repeat protein
MFAERETHKTYWAVVMKAPKQSTARLVHFLHRNPKQNKSYAHVKEVPDSKIGVLTYTKIKSLQRYTLLEIDLETGRHHQIRSQLSYIGSPIKGDLKYGFDRSNKDGGEFFDWYLGLVQHDMGNYEEALNWYTKALDGYPDSAMLLNNIGLVYYDLENYERAAFYAGKALVVDPYYQGAIDLLELTTEY